MASGGTIGGTGVVTTTDATVTSAVQVAISENSSAVLQVKVTARRVSNGNVKGWILAFAVSRDTGDVSITGNILNTLFSAGDLGAATWTIQLDPNADNVNVQVKGQASTEIDWMVEVDGAEVVH